MNLTINPMEDVSVYADRVTLWINTLPDIVSVVQQFAPSIVGRK